MLRGSTKPMTVQEIANRVQRATGGTVSLTAVNTALERARYQRTAVQQTRTTWRIAQKAR